MTALSLSRRSLLAAFGALGLGLAFRPAFAADELSFDDLYGSFSPLGLKFSDKVKQLTERRSRFAASWPRR